MYTFHYTDPRMEHTDPHVWTTKNKDPHTDHTDPTWTTHYTDPHVDHTVPHMDHTSTQILMYGPQRPLCMDHTDPHMDHTDPHMDYTGPYMDHTILYLVCSCLTVSVLLLQNLN